jgi:hypothetical protein
MGKTRKRMTMAKYANKYAAKRAGLNVRKDTTTDTISLEEPVIETAATVDTPVEVLTTKDFTEENDTDVIVVKNKVKEEAHHKQQHVPAPDLQLQQVEIEKPTHKPAGLKQARRKTTTRRKTTKTKTD